MKIKLFGAYRDGGDGSFTIRLFGTREEALKHLDRTKEQLDNGDYYEDGAISEAEIEVDSEGKIIKPGYISVG